MIGHAATPQPWIPRIMALAEATLASKIMISDTAHRPWPLPRQPWIMRMDWHDLLFMHWPISSDLLRRYIPPTLAIDIFGGSAWIGIVPFRMHRVVPRLIPPVPYLSAFPEINVRTYVSAEGKPGVWFFSLDAGNRIAVEAARDAFHLPYYNARMTCHPSVDSVQYSSVRTHRRAGRISGAVSANRPSLFFDSRNARKLADRTLLPVCCESARHDLARRDSSSPMAAPAGRG